MTAQEIVQALAGCTPEQIQYLAENFAIGWMRGLAPKRKPAPEPPKRKGQPLAQIVEMMWEQEQVNSAALDEWERNENHSCSADGGCAICRVWQPERSRRLRRLSTLYTRAQQAGFELDEEQAARECGIPAETIKHMLEELRAR